MYCQSCGKPNPQQTPYCRHCGNPLVLSPNPQVNPYAASSAGVSKPVGQKPYNYLIPAILSTLCCCLPLGIVSIVYASQVDGKWSSGDAHGAVNAANNAKMWFYLSLASGLVINVVGVGIQVLAIVSQIQQQH
jgi:hypothetical protein